MKIFCKKIFISDFFFFKNGSFCPAKMTHFCMQNGQNRLCRFWSFWRSARKSALLDRVLIKNQPKSQKSTLPIFDFLTGF